MLDFKYLGWQGLRDCGRKSNKFIWWRDIKKVCGREDDIWFDEMVEWKIRDGSHTRFWKDRWSGSVSERLQHKFVRLFHNSKQKEECVEKMDTWRNGRWVLEFVLSFLIGISGLWDSTKQCEKSLSSFEGKH